MISTRLFVVVVGRAVSVINRVKGEAYGRKLLTRFSDKFVTSGWPGHTRPWVNLHTSQFLWSVRRRVYPTKQIPHRSPRTHMTTPLRIGCFGAFRGLLSFPKQLFEQFPPGAQLFIFDLSHESGYAEYLRTLATGYWPVELDSGDSYSERIRSTASAINNADLDLLLIINWKSESHDLIDLVETPCIVNICTGLDLLHHPKVSFQLQPHDQADYFNAGNAIFCGTNRSRLRGHLVYPGFLFYDPRGMDSAAKCSWAQRDPLIVFHGSLYKLAHQPLLECIYSVMLADSDLHFVIVGKDNGHALAMINNLATKKGVQSRVHYEGEFSGVRDANGIICDPGWRKMLSYLQRARLMPDPWPIGGASARFEAYAMGVPCVSMVLRVDPMSWGRPQHKISEPLALVTNAGTARSEAEYAELCRRCLYDGAFADQLAAEQLEVAKKVSDPVAWWQQLLGFYHDWLDRYAGSRVA